MRAVRVSAIVPVYNGERFLRSAVESALAQRFGSLEVIVVDDGSSDDSGAIADDLARRAPDRVRVIHQANQGLVGARNTAIAAARGEFLALLDADDVWQPDHLQDAVGVLDRAPEVGLVHANIERIDAEGRSLGVPARYWDRHPPAQAYAAVLLRQEHVSCPTAVFRRSAVDRVGPFDPAFNRLGCEDRDLWLRIAAVSSLHYIDKVAALYRQHGANMSANDDKMMRARLLLVERHARIPQGAALRARALAAIHCDLGHDLRGRRRRAAASAEYVRALRLQPFSSTAWKGLARSLAGRA